VGQAYEVGDDDRLAHDEDERDRLGPEAPGHEAEHLCRRPIEPVGIVDQTEQRQVGGGLGQQAERRHADQEPVGWGAVAQAERGPQRVTLRGRQALEVIEQRDAQLLEACERQLHLRLDPGRADDVEALGAAHHVLQQRGLSRACHAAQQQDPALLGPCIREEAVKRGALLDSSKQHRSRAPPSLYPPDTIGTIRISRAPAREASSPPQSRWSVAST
jgi:hypothetical protein